MKLPNKFEDYPKGLRTRILFYRNKYPTEQLSAINSFTWRRTVEGHAYWCTLNYQQEYDKRFEPKLKLY